MRVRGDGRTDQVRVVSDARYRGMRQTVQKVLDHAGEVSSASESKRAWTHRGVLDRIHMSVVSHQQGFGPVSGL